MERDENGQFVIGHAAMGGRPRGSRNKLGHAFIEGLYAHWLENGATVIATAATQSPAAYLRIVAMLLPKHLEIKEDPFDVLNDEELSEIIAYTQNAIALLKQGE